MAFASPRKRHFPRVFRATVALASALGFACGGGDKIAGPEPVESVSVAIAASNLVAGSQTQATAITRDAEGDILTGRSLTWTSSDTEVATVSSTGEVTAVRPGTAEIRATSEGKQGAAVLTVTPVPIHSITVVIADPSMQVGGTRQASAVAKDATGNELTGRPIVWSTDNADVATVSPQGMATGVKPGTATITATSEGKSGSAMFTVNANVSAVVVTLPQPGLAVGFSIPASVTVKDAAGNPVTGQPVTWSSSNTAVVTVSESGVVTGVARGDADIIATSNGTSGSATIGVVVIRPRSLSKGVIHACAIATDGDTYCWGRNEWGQLGTGSTSSSSVPVRVAGGLKFVAVSAAITSTYALSENGKMYCWGSCERDFIQDPPRLTPQPWITARAVEILEAGKSGGSGTPDCVFRFGETAYCWGGNLHGELGRGVRGAALTMYPEGPVAGNHAFADIATANGEHVCGITTAGVAYCWGGGKSGERGALGGGAGAAKESLAPQRVISDQLFKDIAVADEHTCAVTTAGQAYCWGNNTYGELGTSVEGCPWPQLLYGDSCSAIPVAVSGGHVFQSISLGGGVSCGLKTDGEIYCWGAGFGITPRPFGGSDRYLSLSVGCAISTDGDAYCLNSDSRPTKVAGGIKFRAP